MSSTGSGDLSTFYTFFSSETLTALAAAAVASEVAAAAVALEVATAASERAAVALGVATVPTVAAAEKALWLPALDWSTFFVF